MRRLRNLSASGKGSKCRMNQNGDLPTLSNRSLLNFSPATGFSSIFQSPVCTMVPWSLLNIRPQQSGMECVTLTGSQLQQNWQEISKLKFHRLCFKTVHKRKSKKILLQRQWAMQYINVLLRGSLRQTQIQAFQKMWCFESMIFIRCLYWSLVPRRCVSWD